MGEYYEFIVFCGEPYIEFQSPQTEWKTEAVKLSQKKALQIEEFEVKQRNDMQNFLREMARADNDQ